MFWQIYVLFEQTNMAVNGFMFVTKQIFYPQFWNLIELLHYVTGFICLELKLMSSCEEGDCWINWSDQFYLNPVHLAVDTLEMLWA